MATKIPAFTDIGKATKELLYGGKDGVFQYCNVVTITSKTADGVEFVTTAVSKPGDGVDTAIKATYKFNKYNIGAAFSSGGKVALTTKIVDAAPNLDIALTGTVPDISSAQLGLDYSIPYLTLKSAIGLTATPAVLVSATTGYEGFVLGGDASYDTARSKVTKWSVAAGYSSLDYQIAALLTDMGETAKVSFAHNIDATQVVGAEVSKKVSKDDAALFTLGYAKKLDAGAITKFRLDNTGILSFLYETELQATKSKIAVTASTDVTDLNKPAKFGFALSHTA